MTKSDLQQQLQQAMMAKDELRVSTLRMLLSAVQASERSGAFHEATEDEILSLIGREVKHRKEAIEEYKKGGRENLASKERAELTVLESYLPQQLAPEELRTLVIEAIQSVGATSANDFGKVMKEMIVKTKGRADGKTVSDLVKLLLTS